MVYNVFLRHGTCPRPQIKRMKHYKNKNKKNKHGKITGHVGGRGGGGGGTAHGCIDLPRVGGQQCICIFIGLLYMITWLLYDVYMMFI